MPNWQRFDPLILEIDTSGVTGYDVRSTATSTYWQYVNLDLDDGEAADSEPGPVTVFLYACGGEPHGLDGDAYVGFDPARR